MVKIRLKRVGRKNSPSYKIVVTDSRNSRDGKFLESVGFYDPCHNKEAVKLDRVKYWVSVGAQLSNTVSDIVRRGETGETTTNNKVKQKKQKEVLKAEEKKEDESNKKNVSEEVKEETANKEISENKKDSTTQEDVSE